MTEAHKTDGLAELVCSNSFRSDDAETNAVGLLHEEMRRAGGLIIAMGDKHKVPAGSALVYSGRLWHAAGHNGAETTRRALICEHVLPWLRPADNHILATGVDQLRKLSPQLRRLAGVAPADEYLGFVGGQDPEEWLRQISSD